MWVYIIVQELQVEPRLMPNWPSLAVVWTGYTKYVRLLAGSTAAPRGPPATYLRWVGAVANWWSRFPSVYFYLILFYILRTYSILPLFFFLGNYSNYSN